MKSLAQLSITSLTELPNKDAVSLEAKPVLSALKSSFLGSGGFLGVCASHVWTFWAPAWFMWLCFDCFEPLFTIEVDSRLSRRPLGISAYDVAFWAYKKHAPLGLEDNKTWQKGHDNRNFCVSRLVCLSSMTPIGLNGCCSRHCEIDQDASVFGDICMPLYKQNPLQPFEQDFQWRQHYVSLHLRHLNLKCTLWCLPVSQVYQEAHERCYAISGSTSEAENITLLLLWRQRKFI